MLLAHRHPRVYDGRLPARLTDGNSNVTRLVLKDRKGFVRLAVEHGMDLVPGVCFCEKWVHETVLLPMPIRNFLYKHFRLAGVLLKGRWWTFLGQISKADGTPINLGFVWGAPIPVRQDATCNAEYVDRVHAAYVEAVQDLFHRYKHRFGYGSMETIQIVSAKDS